MPFEGKEVYQLYNSHQQKDNVVYKLAGTAAKVFFFDLVWITEAFAKSAFDITIPGCPICSDNKYEEA